MSENKKQGFDLGGTDWLNLVWRRRKLFVLPFVIVTAAGLGLGSLLPKGYESKTVTKVIDSSFLSSVYRGLSVARPSVEFTAAEYEIKKKEDLEQILREEGHLADKRDAAERHEAIESIRDRIKVEVITPKIGGGDKLLKISVLARTPHQAQTLVTRITENYVNQLTRRYRGSVYNMRDKAIVEHERAQSKFDEAEDALREFEEDHQDAIAIGESRSNIERDIEKNNDQIQSWTNELYQLDANINALDGQLASLEPETIKTIVEKNPEYERIAGAILITKTQVDALKIDRTTDHPEVKQLEVQLERLKEEIAKYPRYLRNEELAVRNPMWDAAKLEHAKLMQRRDNLTGQMMKKQERVKKMQERYKKLPEINAQRKRFESQLSDLDEDLSRYTERKWHADTAWKRVVATLDDLFIPIEHASKPLKHSTPPATMILLISLGLGLAAGLGLVFVAELGRKTFFSPEDVTAMISLPILGMVHTILSPRETQQRARKRAAALLGMLLVALGVCTVVYVYNRNPSLLPPVVVDSVQRVKDFVS